MRRNDKDSDLSLDFKALGTKKYKYNLNSEDESNLIAMNGIISRNSSDNHFKIEICNNAMQSLVQIFITINCFQLIANLVMGDKSNPFDHFKNLCYIGLLLPSLKLSRDQLEISELIRAKRHMQIK